MKARYLLGILFLLPISFVHASFTDVEDTHENFDAISYVQSEGIVSGYEDGTFQSEKIINRAEFTKIIVSALYGNTIQGSGCFPDIQDEWYAKYVCTAKRQQFIKGYPDGTFKPGEPILFVEAAKIIAEAFNLETNDALTDEWYTPYIATLEKRNAVPVSIEALSKKITRGEFAELVYRVQNNIRNKATTSFSSPSIDNATSGDSTNSTGSYRISTSQQSSEENISTNTGQTYEDYSPTHQTSLIGKKDVVLFFHAKWCPICKKLEADITSQLSIFPENTHILQVDFDTELELKKQYGVTIQYTFVFLDAEGNVTHKITKGNVTHKITTGDYQKVLAAAKDFIK